MSIRVLLAPVLLALAASSQAQTVTVSGELTVPFEPPVLQCGGPVNVFELKGTGVFVDPGPFPLFQFVGDHVEVTGPLAPATCTIVQATSFSLAPYVLETCGGGALACPTRVVLSSKGGGLYFLFVALDNGFLPFGSAGTFVLDPFGAVLLASGIETSQTTKLDFTIPPDPAIQALVLRLQSVRTVPQVPGTIQLSTVDTIFTGTFHTPCHLPGC